MIDQSLSRRVFLKRASQVCGVVAFLPFAGSLGRAFAASTEKYYEHTILAMGTTARVGVYSTSESQANTVINAAFTELKRLESLFTIFNAQSEIGQLNEHAGSAPRPVSPDTFSILQSAAAYMKQTHRAFDPTIEPLMRLWGFRNDTKELAALPSTHEINAALQYVGPDQLILNAPNQTVRLRSKGAKLDLGGIADGYALDKMAAIIRAAGIESAFIDISGDMYAIGAPPNKEGWEVAIPNPQHPSRFVHTTFIKDQALATSGNYMSYVVYNAVRFGHIMDPHEGCSAHRVLSATVTAPTGIDADALSTASFVSGNRYGDTKLLLVSPQGTLLQS